MNRFLLNNLAKTLMDAIGFARPGPILISARMGSFFARRAPAVTMVSFFRRNSVTTCFEGHRVLARATQLKEPSPTQNTASDSSAHGFHPSRAPVCFPWRFSS